MDEARADDGSSEKNRADLAWFLIRQQDSRLSAIQHMIGPHLGDTLEATEVLPESTGRGLLIERTTPGDIGAHLGAGFIVREETTNERHGIPASFEVKVIDPQDKALDRATCEACGLSWDDGIVTDYTPVPSARCPFEAWHIEEPEEDDEEPEPERWEVTVQRAAEALTRALEAVPSNVIHYAVEGARVPVQILAVQMKKRINKQEDPPTVPETGGSRTEYQHERHGWVPCDVVASPRDGFFTVDTGRSQPWMGTYYDVPASQIRKV